MAHIDKSSEHDDEKNARPDPIPGEPSLENLPADWAKEDRLMERRRPDLGETEKDELQL